MYRLAVLRRTRPGGHLVASLFLPSDGEYVLVDGMLRRLRLQYPDAIYHLMARGNGRQDIVCDDVDRDRLQENLGRAAIRCSWHVYAFAIMSNHLTGGSSEVALSSIESRQWCAESHVASGERESRLLQSLPLSRVIATVCAYFEIEDTELSSRGSRHPARAALAYLARSRTMSTNTELATILGLSRAECVPNLTRRFAVLLATDVGLRRHMRPLEDQLDEDGPPK
jgi:hypothetical protein